MEDKNKILSEKERYEVRQIAVMQTDRYEVRQFVVNQS